MDHYLDIRLLPDPEFSAPMLMNALFAKLHRALAADASIDIAISFPDATASHLGRVMRLHGSVARLTAHMTKTWLGGMRDHLEITRVEPVPPMAVPYQVRRVQVKSNAARLRRRYLKRHPTTDSSSVVELIPDRVERLLALPHLRINSTSSGQQFLLFIQQTQASETRTGEFNSYGLSITATVPWF